MLFLISVILFHFNQLLPHLLDSLIVFFCIIHLSLDVFKQQTVPFPKQMTLMSDIADLTSEIYFHGFNKTLEIICSLRVMRSHS